MRRTLRGLVILVLAFAVVLAAGTLVPRPLIAEGETGAEGSRHILVFTNPIHTDIAIPIDGAIRETFGFLRQTGMPIDEPGARYLVFGWGSRAFYIATPTWSDLKAGPLFKGLTLDRSAMHVDITGAVVESHPAVRRYSLDAAGYERLVRFIRASFAETPNGEPILIPDVGYGAYDQFYEANGTFTALLGCNTWTARGLRLAGLRTGWWNPLPISLGWSLDLYNQPREGGSQP